MFSIHDDDGNPVKIQAGMCIGFYTEFHYLVLMKASGDGSRLKWADRDDKMVAEFIRDEIDFLTFVRILAQTHGLNVEADYRRPYGPAYRFITPADTPSPQR